jgi:ubiquinone/menaquinone biosynthesis C-methylase UbiE
MKYTPKKPQKSTSWEPASKWYKNIVGEEGHYYHQNIIIPGILRLFDFKEVCKNTTAEEQNASDAPRSRSNRLSYSCTLPKSTPDASLLDLACGNGVLARHLPKNVAYSGIDISPTFIKDAKSLDKAPNHHYYVGDATQKLPLKEGPFSHAAIILALQNIHSPLKVFQNFAQHLQKDAKLIIVLNHPCFRIPRQSSWEVDQNKKIQYRRIERYASPLEIPLLAHPSKGAQSEQLISYHFPVSSFIHWLGEAGFCVTDMEEWCSNKTSEGGAAKMENRARSEFPLFMTICAKKV